VAYLVLPPWMAGMLAMQEQLPVLVSRRQDDA